MAAVALGGCLFWKDVEPGPAMMPAPLPTYAVGDTFTFDNGRSYRVERISAKTGQIKWRRGRSRTYYGPPNFVIPYRKWSNRRARGSFETDAEDDTLWPLSVGASDYFVGRSESRRKGRDQKSQSIRAYDCEVDGTRTLSLAIGTFDTYRVVCRRYTRGRSLSRVYHWYYAPAIGHYVQKDTFKRHGEMTSSMKLTSVLRADRGLTEAARAIRNELLTEALEKLPSGTVRDWQDPVSKIGVAVTVAGTFKTGSGAFCRRYRQEITLGSQTRVDPGIACRTQDGWQRI